MKMKMFKMIPKLKKTLLIQ